MPDNNYENQYAYDSDNSSQGPKSAFTSITSTLTKYYIVVLFILLLLIFAFLFIFFNSTTDRVTRRSLESAVAETVNSLSAEPSSSGNYLVSIPVDFEYFIDGVEIMIYNNEGEYTIGSQPGGFPENTSFVNDEHREIINSSGTEYYIFDRYVNLGSGGIWVRGVYPHDPVNSLIRNTLNAVTIIFPLLIIAIIVVGYFITRRSLKPLDSLIDEVEDIQDNTDLNHELTVPHGPRGRRNEISILAERFNELLDRLNTSFLKEQQFTSDASHELRTPVAAITAQAEAGLLDNSTPEDMRHSLERIQAQSKNMNTLIVQLLELTRADRGTATVNIEKINFSELAEDISFTLQDMADNYNVTLQTSVEEDLYIHGDEVLLMRLIINLASNGIKYGKTNGFVTIDTRLDNGKVLLNVQDNGIGISQEDLSKIFDRFYRVSSSRSSSEQAEYSSGLGLSMVQWIVETHNGRIEVNSTLNVGSQFLVWLPLAGSDNAPEIGRHGGKVQAPAEPTSVEDEDDENKDFRRPNH